MTRLQDRLTRELGEIADRATTSPPTIETLRERALEAGPLDDEVVVRLSPAGTTRGRSIRGERVALAVAAAVILVLVGALVLRSSDNSEELRADIPPPTDTIAPVADDAVFDFSRHDLCAWLSDADVASFVASEIADAGSVEASWQPEESRSEPYTSCSWWLVTDDMGAGELVISDASAWTNFDGEPYVHPFDHEVVPYSYVADAQRYPEDPGWIPIGAAVSGHFALSTDAVVHNGGFGQYAFWSWERQGHVQVDLGLDGPVPSHELFGVADLVLRDLGWIE